MSKLLKVMKEKYDKGHISYHREYWKGILNHTENLERQLSKREDDYRNLRERSDKQIEDLERQLAEARVTRYREITAIRTRFEVFIRGEWSAQEFRDYMKQLKEKG